MLMSVEGEIASRGMESVVTVDGCWCKTQGRRRRRVHNDGRKGGGGWLKREGFEKEMARASPELPDTEGGVVRPTGSNLQALPSSPARNQT